MKTFLSLLLALVTLGATVVLGRAALEILTGQYVGWQDAITVLLAVYLISWLVRE